MIDVYYASLTSQEVRHRVFYPTLTLTPNINPVQKATVFFPLVIAIQAEITEEVAKLW